MRRVVLSDVHGNARALSSALEMCRELAPDEVVILGDLLTYGPDVMSVLDLLEEQAARVRTVWVRGNHEEIYTDLARGERQYIDGLPAWIRDSVSFTADRLDIGRLAAIPMVMEYEAQGVLFAHANPWGSWRYVNTAADHAEAAETLASRGFLAGVFGHTHRSRLYRHPEGTGSTDDHPMTTTLLSDATDRLVVNAGSVGQPRNRAAVSTLLVIDGSSNALQFTVRRLSYDLTGHVDALMRMPVPDASRRRLAAFFSAAMH